MKPKVFIVTVIITNIISLSEDKMIDCYHCILKMLRNTSRCCG